MFIRVYLCPSVVKKFFAGVIKGWFWQIAHKKGDVMTVWMQETPGSPQEIYLPDSFTARRHFILLWSRRSEFASLFLGTGGTYPGRSGTVVQKIEIEPLDDENFDNSGIANPARTLAAGRWARGTVTYGPEPTESE